MLSGVGQEEFVGTNNLSYSSNFQELLSPCMCVRAVVIRVRCKRKICRRITIAIKDSAIVAFDK